MTKHSGELVKNRGTIIGFILRATDSIADLYHLGRLFHRPCDNGDGFISCIFIVFTNGIPMPIQIYSSSLQGR